MPYNAIEGPAPFETTFTGEYRDSGRPEPGAQFKVTSKFDRPVRISNAWLYAYDKDGNQLELTARDGSKMKYVQDSKRGLLEIAPGETKSFVHSVHKGMLPDDVDTLQLEFTMWESVDGDETYERNIETGLDEVRPKDGWT